MFHQKVKEIRKELDLKVPEFSKILGVHRTSIYNWEAGHAQPIKDKRQLLLEIEKILNSDKKEKLKTKLKEASFMEENAYLETLQTIFNINHNKEPTLSI